MASGPPRLRFTWRDGDLFVIVNDEGLVLANVTMPLRHLVYGICRRLIDRAKRRGVIPRSK